MCKSASPALQQKFLPRLSTGTIGSFCLSESESGSDAFALRTVAKETGEADLFRINGSKMWISNAQEAGLFLVFANVKPEAGYKGITCFVVEAEDPGVKVGKKERKVAKGSGRVFNLFR